MGNSFPSAMCKPVGTNTRIEFSREDCYGKEISSEKRYVKYVDLSVVALSLVRTYGKDGDTKRLRFQFVEPIIITFIIDRAENNLLNKIEDFGLSYHKKFEVNKNHWGGGGVTKLKVLYRMNENNGNFIVVEEKRRSEFEKPWAVTLGHYYANSNRSFFFRKKYDVGLSMVVDIKVLNNNLDVSVKGPSEHPPFALLYMFQQVSMTRTWNWTACPESASETQIETETASAHRARIESLLNDLHRQVNNGSFQPSNGRIPKKVILIENSGSIIGDNNGNLVIKGDLYTFNISGNNFLETSQSIIKLCKMLGVQDIEMKKEEWDSFDMLM